MELTSVERTLRPDFAMDSGGAFFWLDAFEETAEEAALVEEIPAEDPGLSGPCGEPLGATGFPA